MSAQIDDVEADIEKQDALDKETPKQEEKIDSKGESKSDFNKRFSPPPEMMNPKIKRDEVKTGDPKKDEEVKAGEHKQPFIKKIIGEKQAAEEKATSLEKEKADLQAQIVTLTAKAEGTENPAKEAEYEARIKVAEGKLAEANKRDGELSTLKKRLSAYDLQYDDEFQERFIKPLEKGFSAISGIIGNDKGKAHHLQTAVQKFGGAIGVVGDEANDARREAYELLDAITEDLPRMAQTQFSGLMEEIFGLMKQQKVALANPENSREYLAEERRKENAKQAARLHEQWEAEYKGADIGALPVVEDFDEVVKKLGIDADTSEDEKYAKAAYTPEADRKKTVQILRQGSQFRKAVAIAKVLQAKLDEAKETIAALRGAGGGGGSGGSGSTNGAKPTRTEFNKRFSPPAGVR